MIAGGCPRNDYSISCNISLAIVRRYIYNRINDKEGPRVTEPERRLLEILKAKQSDLQLLDVPFSRELGISQGYWSLVKNGKRNIGRRMAGKVLRFPDLWRDVQEAMFPREGAA
jgi:hypothetical protein